MNVEPGRYIWRNKNQDQFVDVKSALGKGPDGRLYVKIDGSNTGIPFDECRKESIVLSRKPTRSKGAF
jgi:hypothetical protein